MVLFEMLWNNNYWSVAVLMALISVPLVAVVYMIGKSISSNQMVAWAKDEFYQYVGSLLIIATVITSLALINSVVLETLGAAGFACDSNGCHFTHQTFDNNGKIVTNTENCGGLNENPCHIAIAKAGINAQYDLIRYYAAGQIYWYGMISIMSKVSISISPEIPWIQKRIPGVGISIKPLAGLDIIGDVYDNMLDLIYVMMFMVKANWFFLEAVSVAIFPFFLVAGIALRSLSITRKIGGLLLATALVLFFIYPMIIILTEMMISPNPTEFKVDFTDVYTRNTDDLSKQPSILNFFDEMSYNVNGKTIDFISYWMFKPIMPYTVKDGVISPGGVADTVAFFTVWITFQFMIVMYATVISIRELSPFFGGDIEIAGLTRLM